MKYLNPGKGNQCSALLCTVPSTRQRTPHPPHNNSGRERRYPVCVSLRDNVFNVERYPNGVYQITFPLIPQTRLYNTSICLSSKSHRRSTGLLSTSLRHSSPIPAARRKRFYSRLMAANATHARVAFTCARANSS